MAKVYTAIDAATMEVRAVEFTNSGTGDAPMLPGLRSQIPVREPITCVTADGAHDGRTRRNAIATRGHGALAGVLEPMAINARTRRNAKPWKKDSPGAPAGNEALRVIKRFGRTLWRKWSGDHRRSRVETKPPGTLLRNALPANG